MSNNNNKKKSQVGAVRRRQPAKTNKRVNRGISKPIDAPVAKGFKVTNQKPTMKISGPDRQNLFVSHREYIRDVPPQTAAFGILFSLNVNPGDPVCFPWLYSIAQRFESYRFRKLKFHYVTEAPTTERGYVLLCLDYDASDAAPLDKVSAFQYQGSARTAPWDNIVHISTAENISKRRSYFVRTAPLQIGNDPTLYDTGTMYVIAGGNVGPNSLGELFVEYEVELMTPQIAAPNSTGLDSAVFSGGTLTTANPLGTAGVVQFSNSPYFNYTNTTGLFTGLVQARLMVTFDLLTGAGITALTIATANGATASTLYPLANSGTVAIQGWILNLVPGGTFSFTVTGTSVANCKVLLTSWSI